MKTSLISLFPTLQAELWYIPFWLGRAGEEMTGDDLFELQYLAFEHCNMGSNNDGIWSEHISPSERNVFAAVMEPDEGALQVLLEMYDFAEEASQDTVGWD